MEIKIDTQKDSKEDIKKIIEFLKKFVEEVKKPETIKIFDDELKNKKKFKKQKLEEEEPEEKIKIVEY